MFKRLLVKFADRITRKYGCFNLAIGDTVIVNNRAYVINQLRTSKEYFKHDLVVEASDIIPFKY